MIAPTIPRPSLWLAFASVTLIAATGSSDDRSQRRSLELFEKHVRPTLLEHCVRCHGPEKQQGGLRLDSKSRLREGGDSGETVVAGEPDQSLLLGALRYEDFEMPPRGQLPDATIAAFEQWIALGAADPRVDEPDRPGADEGTLEPTVEEGRDFWSFQPITSPTPPAVANDAWPLTDIDRFILSRLERAGIAPVPDAGRQTLIRRLYYDLIGLPPTPQEIEAFVNDESADAYEELVERLLQSPHFGERWARHWLDVVRFAESSGGGRTLLFPNAWRYRDYVINAFNRDLPYDRFLKEQVAGDLLPHEDWEDERRHLVATAFLLLGPTNYELQDKDVLEMDVVDEQLDTIGKALLGMTLGCARCHDHKFDPIPTEDYYALAGILRSTKAMIHSNVSTWNKVNLPLPPEDEREFRGIEKRVGRLKQQIKAAKEQLEQAAAVSEDDKSKGEQLKELESPADESPTPEAKAVAERHRLNERVKALETKLKQAERHLAERPIGMVAADDDDAGDIHIAIRGVVHNRGKLVSRGVLQVASDDPRPAISEGESGRRELAEWLTEPSNPLTARVMVNRVWYWLMGRGIVPTVDNFGRMGSDPTHPQLLDHLATSFTRDGWSLKRLVREIVLSRVYRLESQADPQSPLTVVARQHDPQNQLLWRMNRKRLDAESIRDTLLFVAGTIDQRMGGPNIKPQTRSEYGYRFESRRRSVYVPVFRNTLPEVFEVFDFADPNIQSGSRSSSTIATQALWLMNHPFVLKQSNLAAERLLSRDNLAAEEAIEFAFLETLGRPPLAEEAAAATRFVRKGEDKDGSLSRWSLLYQTLFQTIDFRYLN